MGLESKMSSDFEEIDKLIKKETRRLSGNIPFDALFNKNFMSMYTNFDTLEELLSSGGYENAESEKDIEKIQNDEFDKYIEANTKFSSWNQMYTKAGQVYVSTDCKL